MATPSAGGAGATGSNSSASTGSGTLGAGTKAAAGFFSNLISGRSPLGIPGIARLEAEARAEVQASSSTPPGPPPAATAGEAGPTRDDLVRLVRRLRGTNRAYEADLTALRSEREAVVGALLELQVLVAQDGGDGGDILQRVPVGSLDRALLLDAWTRALRAAQPAQLQSPAEGWRSPTGVAVSRADVSGIAEPSSATPNDGGNDKAPGWGGEQLDFTSPMASTPLASQAQTFSSRVDELQRENVALVARSKEQADRIADLQASIAVRDAELVAARSETEVSRAALHLLEGKLAETSAELSNKTAAHDKIMEHSRRLYVKYKDLQAAQATAASTAAEPAPPSTTDGTSLAAQLAASEAALNEQASAVRRLQLDLDDARRELDALRNAVPPPPPPCSSCESLRSELEGVSARVAMEHAAAVRATAAAAEATVTVSHLEVEVASSAARATAARLEAEAASAAAAATASRLEAEVAAVTAERDVATRALRHASEESDAACSALTREVAALRAELDAAKERETAAAARESEYADAAAAQLGVLRARLSEASTVAAAATADADALREQLGSLEVERDDAAARAAAAEATAAATAAAVDALTASRAATASDAEMAAAEAARLRGKVADLVQREAELTVNLAAATDAAARAQHDAAIAAAAATAADLRAEAASAARADAETALSDIASRNSADDHDALARATATASAGREAAAAVVAAEAARHDAGECPMKWLSFVVVQAPSCFQLLPALRASYHCSESCNGRRGCTRRCK